MPIPTILIDGKPMSRIADGVPAFDPATKVSLSADINYTFTKDSYFECVAMDN
jgi:hypothetical protein